MTLPPAHIQKPVLNASLYDFASFKGGSRVINTPKWSKYVHVFALPVILTIVNEDFGVFLDFTGADDKYIGPALVNNQREASIIV